MENHLKWKEINIGDTPIFHWTMIMGELWEEGYQNWIHQTSLTSRVVPTIGFLHMHACMPTLPQVHVAWLLWKNPQEARKVYWAFWRRNYYKVGLGGKIFNEGQGFTNKFCMFFELDEIFVFETWPFPLGLGCCEGCRGTVVLVDTFSGADLGSTWVRRSGWWLSQEGFQKGKLLDPPCIISIQANKNLYSFLKFHHSPSWLVWAVSDSSPVDTWGLIIWLFRGEIPGWLGDTLITWKHPKEHVKSSFQISGVTPTKTNVTIAGKSTVWRCISFLNMGSFQCHVSFQELTWNWPMYQCVSHFQPGARSYHCYPCHRASPGPAQTGSGRAPVGFLRLRTWKPVVLDMIQVDLQFWRCIDGT